MLAGIALAAVLAVSGCASGGGKFRLDMAKSCQAHGGTWSQAQETCSMSGSEAASRAKSAKDICAYQGGTYLPGGTCMLEGAGM
ncbi:MAG TPA: hypothetical protein VEG33_01290 [Streptosporangiaceae bacterium]|nr:hypothetical protein [Streptosporangiaceae bacterium]